MRHLRLGCALVSLALAWPLGFVLYKSHRVASELVDPPFYKPQPLAKVAQTYAELAAGSEGDPGGTWSSQEVKGLQLWTLTRRTPSRGHVLLLHGFGDDRWGTSPALKWFPDLDASIFTYRRRDDVLRAGGQTPITFGALEQLDVITMVHALEHRGVPRHRIILVGRSLGASVALLALARLEAEGGPLGGIIWEGAPASSLDFGERLVRDARDRWWHPVLAPLIGRLGGHMAAWRGEYAAGDTDIRKAVAGHTLRTPSLSFLATQDRLAPAPVQRDVAKHFADSQQIEVATWHLNCPAILGSAYGDQLRAWYRKRLPPKEEP